MLPGALSIISLYFRVAEVCPPSRPTVEPTCNELKSNSSFYCKYYADKDICSACTNATEECVQCVKQKCLARLVLYTYY